MRATGILALSIPPKANNCRSLRSHANLGGKVDSNDDIKDNKKVADRSTETVGENFDANGFSGYLAPYALALLVSILVTGAFVKFVLLDY